MQQRQQRNKRFQYLYEEDFENPLDLEMMELDCGDNDGTLYVEDTYTGIVYQGAAGYGLADDCRRLSRRGLRPNA